MRTPSLRIIHQPHSLPLYILAGFPKPVNDVVRNKLEKELRAGYYIANASPVTQAERYKKGTIDTLIKSVGGFIIRKRGHPLPKNIVAPSRVFLIYIKDGDTEQLLRAFDYFCLPVPIIPTADDDTRSGKPWYFDPSRAAAVAVRTVRSIARGIDPCLYLDAEITQRRGKSPFLLPPSNYLINGRTETLATVFTKCNRGIYDWKSIHDGIAAKVFKKEQLPRAIGLKKKEYFFQDERGIVFCPPLPGEYHGAAWALNEDPSREEIRGTLNTLYRFGMPIVEGFHHDAQRVGCSLRSERLECSLKGSVAVTGTHARIYPNDRVEADMIVQIHADPPQPTR